MATKKEEGEKKVFVAKNAAELQKIRLNKLMSNPVRVFSLHVFSKLRLFPICHANSLNSYIIAHIVAAMFSKLSFAEQASCNSWSSRRETSPSVQPTGVREKYLGSVAPCQCLKSYRFNTNCATLGEGSQCCGGSGRVSVGCELFIDLNVYKNANLAYKWEGLAHQWPGMACHHLGRGDFCSCLFTFRATSWAGLKTGLFVVKLSTLEEDSFLLCFQNKQAAEFFLREPLEVFPPCIQCLSLKFTVEMFLHKQNSWIQIDLKRSQKVLFQEGDLYLETENSRSVSEPKSSILVLKVTETGVMATHMSGEPEVTCTWNT